jgi:hypothetical protein
MSAAPLSRSRLLGRGAALAVAAGAFGVRALPTAAAGAPAGDLAYLRLLVGVELLAADFQARALAARKLAASTTASVRRMHGDEQAHYDGLSALLGAAGQTAATADDIDFAYPARSFASERSILRLASKLETLALGAYLGAIGAIETAQLRLPIAQMAANEAQHVSALAQSLGGGVIGHAFAPALTIDAVSAALDEYES